MIRQIVLFSLFLGCVYGHGRLITPVPRQGSGSLNGKANAPVAGAQAGEEWVCRSAQVQSTKLPVTAGGSLALNWDFGAAHRGDCALYVSYDVSATRGQQKWFKIANLPRCKDQNRQDVAVKIPSFLKNGHAVFRWDWYALHIFPSAEFYSQCFDAMVTGGQAGLPANLNQYKLIGPPLYPANANVLLPSGVKSYRNPFGGDFFMTGPPCAQSMTDNNCAMTQKGSKGFLDIGTTGTGGNTGGTAPVTPAPVTANTGNTPITTYCETHKVVSGDTLSAIADSYKAQNKVVTWQEICSYNSLPSGCDALSIGDDLIIPYKGSKCQHGNYKAAGGSPKTPSGVFAFGVFLTATFSAFLL